MLHYHQSRSRERSKQLNAPNTMTATDMIPALKSIGYDLSDIPAYRIEAGRIVIAIADNDDDDSEDTINDLRKHLPAGASAEWTGNSDTNGAGHTTSDCEITWDEA
jgi:hypothetical protein